MELAFLCDMEGVTELILIRHGQQEFPADMRAASVAEWVDPPLSEVGVRQADAVGQSLRDRGAISAVYTSNLERARETGMQVAKHHGVDATVVPELREVELFRDLPEGKRLVDVVDPLLLRGARERFIRERRWDVYPYSETSEEFRHRVLMAVEGIIASHPGERVAVACHGGVIATYIASVLGLDEDMFFRPHHASVHRVAARDQRRVIRSLDEVHHLEAVDPDLVTW